MANNDRDKVECAACGSVKLGAEPNHGQKKEPKSLFSFGSGASSSGGGFVFGSGGTSQGDTKPVFNLSSGFPFSFGSLKQGGGVSEQQTEDTQKRVPSLHERTPNKEADNTKDYSKCQEMLKNQTSVKQTQQEQKHKEAKEDLIAKFKPSEGSWEGNICMVNNDSDKVECEASGSLKPGAEPHQGQKKDVKPLFSFGTGASSSGGGFSLGTRASSSGGGFSFGTGASSSGGGFSFGTGASSSGGGFSFGTGASSSGGGFSFVSSGASQGIANQGFTLGSFSQTSSSSSGFPFRFGSLKQVGNISERSEETTNVVVQTDEVKEDLMTKPAEVSWECNICMANNDRDKVECAACGSVKLGAEPNQGQKKEPKSLFSFGSGASSSGGGFVFGSGGTSQGDTKPVFNLSSGFPFSFGSLKQGGGVSEQQTEDSQKRVPSLHERTPDKEGDHQRLLRMP